MKTICQIMNSIDKIAPFSSALGFDNVGLQVGDGDAPVTKVLIALDATVSVAEEAAALGAQLILAHHPPIFHPLKAIAPDSVLVSLIQKGIGVVACHTNLDLAPLYGVNCALGEALGLRGLRQDGELFYARLPEPMGVTALAELVKNRLGSQRVLFTPWEKEIKTLALCAGAGGELVFEARGKADLLLTGEARHDEWVYAAEHIPMIAAGHYETEKPFAGLLKRYLEKEHKDVAFLLSQREQNPISAL